MKKIAAILLAVLMVATLAAGCSKKQTADADIALAFVFKNKTGKDIKEAYVYPSGSTELGDNILSEVWQNNTDSAQYKRVIIARKPADSYDIKVVYTDGTDETFTDLALKFNNSVSMKEAGVISVKNDSEVSFTDEEIKAAGVTASRPVAKVDASKTVSLAFMFKNKTGLDASAAYVYPSGSTDKGDNILSGVWKNNTTDDDYLWITIDRPDSDVYDVSVDFTNGKTMLFEKQDLKNSNSASMKDDNGTLSLKYDPTIGADGKPVATASATIDPNAKNLLVQFIFKNKTGKDISEAYLYPTGAADPGENILAEVWKNNTSDDMYLNISLVRAKADTYEIKVNFTDGTSLTFQDLDLISNNNVSMKDTSGAIFLKYVDGAAVTTAADDTAAGDTVTLAFVFKNKMSVKMTAAYVYPTGAADKGESIITEPWVSSNDPTLYKRIIITRPKADKYEMYCEFEDGTNATYKNLDLANKNSASVKALDEISVKSDSEVTFTEEEIKAALAAASTSTETAPAGDTVTLAFVFKNKMSVKMTAAYVYPTGAADKGESIITEPWVSSNDPTLYKRIIITRPKADKYEMYCEFEDGTNATYKNLDLANKNSASVKALDEISVKSDSEVTFTEEEIKAALGK